MQHTLHISFVKQKKSNITCCDVSRLKKRIWWDPSQFYTCCVTAPSYPWWHHQTYYINLRGFSLTITTDSFTILCLHIKKGVLQGDCLGPLVLNLIINTFIQFVSQENFSQLGYSLTNLLRLTLVSIWRRCCSSYWSRIRNPNSVKYLFNI